MYTLLIVFFLVSITFSFLCSLWEAVLLSITPSYAEVKQREGTAIGNHLSDFKANIDKPLAAILTLNTIAHTVGAIGVGAQATSIWADSSPWVTGLVVPAAMTVAILVLSEIIPKTIGATHWKRLAPFTVRSLLLIIALLYPFVWLSQFLTRSLKKDTAGSIYSRSDFLAMAEIGAREGVFEQTESDIISNLLKFAKVTAKDIMTPRTVVFAAPQNMSIGEFFEAHEPLRFSRIPVYHEGSKDNVSGFFLKDELLSEMVQGNASKTIGELCREVMMIPLDFPLPELFSRLLERREHLAVVIDAFGGMAGVVTTEDVIETLLGMEIVDESDHETDMQVLARRNWEARARAHGLIQEAAAAPKNADSVEETGEPLVVVAEPADSGKPTDKG
ncbi:MAG: HlyC/CorC family transporter [Pseudomonadales bacterium]|nr:HlyC/CorC family transporter [Pseudomonadales bacterium]